MRPSSALALVLALTTAAALVAPRPAAAQTAAGIASAASQVCAVMSGTRRLDGRTLQYLQMMDGDLSENNPIEVLLTRDVIRQCPKAYIDYHARIRRSNPFGAHPLVRQSTSLLGSGSAATAAAPASDAPVRCLGKPGMATASGASVSIAFAPGSLSSLAPGQCAWLGRAFRPGEKMPILVSFDDAATALRVRKAFDAGKLWTIWIRGGGSHFAGTFIALGAKTKKVH